MLHNYISISKDFSDTPGPRKIKEGEHSAEEFRTKILVPAFQKALNDGEKLTIDLDSVEGYGTSFLEEIFGGLARQFGIDVVLDNLEIISNQVEYFKEEAIQYINESMNATEE